jgi:hypothetical protein
MVLRELTVVPCDGGGEGDLCRQEVFQIKLDTLHINLWLVSRNTCFLLWLFPDFNVINLCNILKSLSCNHLYINTWEITAFIHMS